MFGNPVNPFLNNNPYNTPIQTIPQTQTQVLCFFVNSQAEAKNIPVQLNTLYVAVNKADKEVYIRQLNNDGNIDFTIYKDVSTIKKEEPKPEKDYTNILAILTSKIEEIHKSIIKPQPQVQTQMQVQQPVISQPQPNTQVIQQEFFANAGVNGNE